MSALTPVRAPRSAWRVLAQVLGVLLAGALGAAVLAGPPPAQAVEPRRSVAKAAEPHLALPWGVQRSQYDEAYGAWLKASGTDKTLLGKIALTPRVRWFGTWNPTDKVAATIRKYIADSQGGDSNALVQLAIFRLWPHGGEKGKEVPLTAADQEAYKAWIRQVAVALDDTRTVIVLEPDLGVALGGSNEKIRLKLTNYAARRLSQQPNVSIYIDASDADWLSVDRSVAMLKAAGVQYVRGFALGATHYGVTSENWAYTDKLVAALAADGIAGKKAVIDTADNGRGFTWHQYYGKHPKGDFDNAETCASASEVRCVTLGPKPTPKTKKDNVDAYLWFGRPWLYRQASPFKMDRALSVAKTTPYQ